MQANKVKLLNNYQLYQLTQNDKLDDETLNRVRMEFDLRNVSTIERKQFEEKYLATFDESVEALEADSWNPLVTAFAMKRHFRHISLLKTFKRKKEAKAYQLQFYAGLCIYVLLLILLIFAFGK